MFKDYKATCIIKYLQFIENLSHKEIQIFEDMS